MANWTEWLFNAAGAWLEGAYKILTGAYQVEAAEAELELAEAALANIERKSASANVVQKIWGNFPKRKAAAQEMVTAKRRRLQELQRYREQQEALPWLRVISHLSRTQQRLRLLAAPPASEAQGEVGQTEQQQPQPQRQQQELPDLPAPSAPSIDEMWRVPGSVADEHASHQHQQTSYADPARKRPASHHHHQQQQGPSNPWHESCCICLDGELTCGLIPCGHRVCRECGPGLVTGLCPLCRRQVTATLVLY